VQLNVINKNSGIKDNNVLHIYQDNNNDLWLALNSGISKVNYSSPLSFFNESSGLVGKVQTVEKHKNAIYIGTSNGIFKQNLNSKDKAYHHFIKLQNFNEDVKSLININNDLLVGTNEGLYFISDNDEIRLVKKIDASAMHWSETKQLLFVVGKNGFGIFEKEPNWKQKKLFLELAIQNVTRIASDVTAKENELIFWVGSSMGAWKINIDEQLNEKHEIYGAEAGLEDNWVMPFEYKTKMLFGTIAGVLEFIDGSTLEALIPDSLKSDSIELPGSFIGSELELPDATSLNYIIFENNKTWLSLDGKVAYFEENSTELIQEPFTSIDKGKLNTLFVDSSFLWIACDEGLVSFNREKQKIYTNPPSVLIRSVISKNDTLFYGIYKGIENYQDTSISQLEENIPILEHEQNSIKITFSSTYEENGYKALYSYKLDGFDENWSEWSSETEADYKKISEGVYTFLVKSKDIYGNESKISKYIFEILPPWYRTILAYISYIIAIILIVLLIIRLSLRRLRKKNEQLEEIVRERTKEIRKQKEEIEEQKEEIEDSISYAQRIQKAVFPLGEYIDNELNDYFILFKPKDVVSGDFYWFIRVNEYKILSIADCTGHGVPGAFMSMLGVSFLNEIVKNENIIQANLVLIELRKKIIEALQQSGKEGEQKDGMDMSLVVLNSNTNEIQFSGANNPLYIISESELQVSSPVSEIKKDDSIVKETDSIKFYEVKPNKMPIAIYLKMDDFDNNIIQLQKGDCLYMFSDGYADQFGGPKGKKFKYKPFKKLLLQNNNKPMKEQHDILDAEFESWRGKHEQIDDVAVMGLRI